jgi:poly-gamma-glutamate synthesis protein (capsule biosynthesis protein)
LLALLGVDVIELTGNHNNDYGYDAYRETLSLYRQAGYRTVGGGLTPEEARQPLFLDLPGGRVAWVACNQAGPYYALASDNPAALGGARPGAADCDRAWLRATLPALHEQADVVILSVQYLEFDRYDPTVEQRQDFISWAQMGADVVLGTQAHFPQTMQVYPGLNRPTYVHFGLGNFLFDQDWWAGARFNLDELVLYDGSLHSVGLVPGIIENQGRPRLMTAQERENFLYVLFNQYGTW